MNTFRYLWQKRGSRWLRCGGGITNGNFCITRPGIYKTNTRINGWWQTPEIFEITLGELKDATWAPGKVGPHGMGIEV